MKTATSNGEQRFQMLHEIFQVFRFGFGGEFCLNANLDLLTAESELETR